MHPILFHFNGIEVETYLVTMFFWIIISWLYLEKKVKNNMLSTNFIDDYFYILAIIFFIFWRIWWVLLNWNIYKTNLISTLYFWDLNFSFYSWLTFMWLFFMIICIIKKEKFSKWLDMIINPFLILVMFLAIWDFASWENYWNPSELPFAVTFNIPEVRYIIPVHPVQAYEFIWIIMIICFMIYFWRKKRVIWTTWFVWISLFFMLEFFLEFFRAKSDFLVYWIKFHFLFFWIALTFWLLWLILKSHRDFDII